MRVFLLAAISTALSAPAMAGPISNSTVLTAGRTALDSLTSIPFDDTKFLSYRFDVNYSNLDYFTYTPDSSAPTRIDIEAIDLPFSPFIFIREGMFDTTEAFELAPPVDSNFLNPCNFPYQGIAGIFCNVDLGAVNPRVTYLPDLQIGQVYTIGIGGSCFTDESSARCNPIIQPFATPARAPRVYDYALQVDIPEPASLTLLGLGLVAGGLARRRGYKKL